MMLVLFEKLYLRIFGNHTAVHSVSALLDHNNHHSLDNVKVLIGEVQS